MNQQRRKFHRIALALVAVVFGGMGWVTSTVHGAEPALERLEPIVVSVPGPRNISYLPVDLIPKIGADRAEGAVLTLLHTGGGGVAIQKMASFNSDFVVAGVPAHMSFKAHGGEIVTLMPVDDLPLFILMVRADLAKQVKRIADLKGRLLGVNASSLSSKTTSQQLLEMLLTSDGVPINEVRIISAGQSWEEQSSMIGSGRVDAIMGDEPFASRLQAEGKVFVLENLSDPTVGKRVPGAGFLHAALATSPQLLHHQPEKIGKMVNMLRRSLEWVASHTPEEMVAMLGINDPVERKYLLESLQKYPRLYSHDGRFSTKQNIDTDTFFHATAANDQRALSLRLETIVNDHWVGRKE